MGSDPVCLCAGDQSFAANLSGGEKCVNVMRVESGSLDEITELIQEIFGANKYPPGSVVCGISQSLAQGGAHHLHHGLDPLCCHSKQKNRGNTSLSTSPCSVT